MNDTVTKPYYVMANLAYGPMYCDLFLNQHVKSLLDETNLPAIADKYKVEYLIFTDPDSINKIGEHENIKKLKQYANVLMMKFDENMKFTARYGALKEMMRISIDYAIKRGGVCSLFVADLVVARDFFTKILSRIDEGYDSVISSPMRAAAESAIPILNKYQHAFSSEDLFRLAFLHMHPLWTHSHWKNPQFTRMPYSMLWNSGMGILNRSFSMAPLVFKPVPEMSGCDMLDVDVPKHCKKPYIAYNWDDCPIIGVEPLFCYYPSWENEAANAAKIGKEFSKDKLDPSQINFLNHRFFYPNETEAQFTPEQIAESDAVVDSIQFAHHVVI